MSLTGTPGDVAAAEQQERYEINTQLMETTFLVVGPSSKEPGKISGGTAFIVAKPVDGNRGSYVMVTAAHVLEDIAGDSATMVFRTKKRRWEIRD